MQRVKQEFHDLLLQNGAEIGACDLSKECAVGDDVFNVNGLGYVVVLASTENPGSWEFEESFVKALIDLSQDQNIWYVFLIVRQDGRGANGYIVSEFNQKPVKKPFEAVDGIYTIKEKRNFDSLRLLLSTDKIVNILLRNKN